MHLLASRQYDRILSSIGTTAYYPRLAVLLGMRVQELEVGSIFRFVMAAIPADSHVWIVSQLAPHLDSANGGANQTLKVLQSGVFLKV